jgi:hypothetical protein
MHPLAAPRDERAVAAVAIRAHGEVLGDGERGEHPPAGGHERGAGRRGGHALQQRGLAGAGRPDDGDDLAGRHRDHARTPR